MRCECRCWTAWAVSLLVFAGCERKEESAIIVSPAVVEEAVAVEEVKAEGAVVPEAQPEMEEAGLVAVALFAENRALKDRVDAQQREIESLQRELAGAMARLDVARLKVADVDMPAPVTRGADVAVGDIARMRVLEVNRDQQVAVVSGGQQAGMKVGMRFFIFRDERMIGQLRLIDVRDTVAGGLIERVEKNVFPEAGDRLVLSSKQDG